MPATETTPALSVRDQLIRVIQAAWKHDLRATIHTTNGGDVSRVIGSTLVDSTDVIALSYDGYEPKDGNEDGSFMRGESPTVELYKLSFRIDRNAGQNADEAVGLFHQLRKYLKDNPTKRFIRHGTPTISYEITLGPGEVIPTDAGFDMFQIPIQLS